MKTLLAVSLLLVPVSNSPTAPVYRHSDDSILERVGSYQYKQADGYSILYCIADKSIHLQCVVHTPADQLVLIEVQAQELAT